MPPDYLLGIFHWRDHAGDLDGHNRALASRCYFGAATDGWSSIPQPQKRIIADASR
jgi:hypothetical protein